MYDPPQKLPLPRIINLLTDLKEERDVLIQNSWVTYPMTKIRRDFEASLEAYPPIKVGTPDPMFRLSRRRTDRPIYLARNIDGRRHRAPSSSVRDGATSCSCPMR